MRVEDIPRVIEIADALDHAPKWVPEVYERVLDPQASPARIALVAGNPDAGVVGFLLAVLIPPHAELEMIGVAKQAQQQGIARYLMAGLMSELIEGQISEVLLEVRESNHPARMLYASLGFVETGRRPSYYPDPEEDAILLRRSLSR